MQNGSRECNEMYSMKEHSILALLSSPINQRELTFDEETTAPKLQYPLDNLRHAFWSITYFIQVELLSDIPLTRWFVTDETLLYLSIIHFRHLKKISSMHFSSTLLDKF